LINSSAGAVLLTGSWNHPNSRGRKGYREEVLYEGRQPMPLLDKAERLKGFAEVELGYSEAQAVAEAGRCFGCDRRLLVNVIRINAVNAMSARWSAPWLTRKPVTRRRQEWRRLRQD